MKANENIEKRTSLKSFLMGTAVYVLLFAIVLVASLFCMRALSNTYAFYPVSGPSMQPTINPTPANVWNEEKGEPEKLQDSVLVRLTEDIAFNDIVIIQENPNKDETIIKRVIAMDGDMITILIDDFSDKQDGLFHTFVVGDCL